MGESPRISVVIPVYNGEDTIGGVIQSVLDQAVKDLEIIVIDNCSTDATRTIVEKFQDAVEYRQNEFNVGAVNNFTRAADAANGLYTKILCADDKLLPGCLERQASALDEHPEAVMTSTRRRIVDAGGKVLRRSHPGRLGMRGFVPGDRAIRRIVRSGGNPIGETSAVLFRTQERREVGAFSDDYPYLVDVDMWARMLTKGGLLAGDMPLCEFRVGNASWSAEIAGKQAEQCIGFIQGLGLRHPDIVSKAEVSVGVAIARMKARGRRIVYRALSLRSR